MSGSNVAVTQAQGKLFGTCPPRTPDPPPQPTHSSPQPPPCASSHSCSFFFVVVAQLGLFITLCGHCVPAFEVFTESREATALVTAPGCEEADGANQGGDGETKVPGLPPWFGDGGGGGLRG